MRNLRILLRVHTKDALSILDTNDPASMQATPARSFETKLIPRQRRSYALRTRSMISNETILSRFLTSISIVSNAPEEIDSARAEPSASPCAPGLTLPSLERFAWSRSFIPSKRFESRFSTRWTRCRWLSTVLAVLSEPSSARSATLSLNKLDAKSVTPCA